MAQMNTPKMKFLQLSQNKPIILILLSIKYVHLVGMSQNTFHSIVLLRIIKTKTKKLKMKLASSIIISQLEYHKLYTIISYYQSQIPIIKVSTIIWWGCLIILTKYKSKNIEEETFKGQMKRNMWKNKTLKCIFLYDKERFFFRFPSLWNIFNSFKLHYKNQDVFHTNGPIFFGNRLAYKLHFLAIIKGLKHN